MTKKDSIAVFKYGIIAPVLYGNSQSQVSYFKSMAQKIYEVPDIGRKRYHWRTFKKWLHLYRKYGYEGLMPLTRSDKGTSRKINPSLHETLKKLALETNFKTVSNFYRYLCKHHIIDREYFTETTLRNFMKNYAISFTPTPRKQRKAFEMPHINMLWTVDFMHGPYLTVGKKKMKTYLCLFIDDYSRVLTGAQFFLAENITACQVTLKKALLTFGIPQKLYCDNGKVFVSEYLHIICARLGIALIHSEPYDSPSRGKVERVFRTIRDMFLPNLNLSTLECLNHALSHWIATEYHKNIHSGINEVPMTRYLNDLPRVTVRQISVQELDEHLYVTIYRKVRNDSTIPVNTIHYEVPARFIGKKIELRYPLESPHDLRIFENNKQVVKIKPVDKHFNAEHTIPYRKEDQDHV